MKARLLVSVLMFIGLLAAAAPAGAAGTATLQNWDNSPVLGFPDGGTPPASNKVSLTATINSIGDLVVITAWCFPATFTGGGCTPVGVTLGNQTAVRTTVPGHLDAGSSGTPGSGQGWIYYVLSAAAAGSQTITFTTVETQQLQVSYMDFKPSAGYTFSHDVDSPLGSGINTGTHIAAPSITSTPGDLLFNFTMTSSHMVDPLGSPWVGAIWQPQMSHFLANSVNLVAYVLSAPSGTTSNNVNTLHGSDSWQALITSFTLTSAGDTQAPATPTNLSATAISSSQINLSWTASTDNVGVTGYKVFRNATQVGTSATATYNDTGLTAGTAYSYTVSAYDAAGNNSPQSTSASATTQAALGSQPWAGILDPSRAIDWSKTVYATIPSVTIQCGSAIPASADITTINNALANCPSGQYVHLGTGTFNLAGAVMLRKSGVVLRGDGPNNTILHFTNYSTCYWSAAVCLKAPGYGVTDEENPDTQPGALQSCDWTAGYAQGSTAIMLNNCGSTPPVGQFLALDQFNDTSETGGVFQCDNPQSAPSPVCRQNGGGNTDGRHSQGITRSQVQLSKITSVSGSGSGPYAVTISPGLYANNWRSSQSPGAWWQAGQLYQAGVENMTIDNSAVATLSGDSTVTTIVSCDGCWMRNVRSLNAKRNHVHIYLSRDTIVRDSYFFGSANQGSPMSYGVEPMLSSDVLIENNIFQQISSPILPSNSPGLVAGYNFTIGNNTGNWMQTSYTHHNAGQTSVLFEGNNMNGFSCDNVWGHGGTQSTAFRNRFTGKDPTTSMSTQAVELDGGCRGFNIIGNVLGTSGYHNTYQVMPSTGNASCDTSVYDFDWTSGRCLSGNLDDSLTHLTLMRWGNYDTVTNGVKWDTTEAQPGAVPFMNANILANPSSHILPSSLYLAGKPSWWPTAKPWPAIGPDVTGGNERDLNGGILGGHAYTIPAEDCYLNILGGPADGSGNVLPFDASACYYATTILYGDVSENGSVTAYDASLAAQYAVGSITLTSTQITKADVSGNGSVTSYDASLIAQYAVGLITKFPVQG